MKNFFLKSRIILIVFFIFITLKSNSGISAEKYEDILIGDRSSPIKIIVYSSLTCPHCANFHINVLPKIKKHYIDKKKVIVILKDFPLDVAALNASKLIQCVEKTRKLELIDEIYESQKIWTDGNTIEEINKNLITIGKKYNLNKNIINQCFENDSLEEWILNSRISAQKKYDIRATPTIIINEKKFDGVINFETMNKKIKKLI